MVEKSFLSPLNTETKLYFLETKCRLISQTLLFDLSLSQCFVTATDDKICTFNTEIILIFFKVQSKSLKHNVEPLKPLKLSNLWPESRPTLQPLPLHGVLKKPHFEFTAILERV
jgi:hypothetical protein